MESATSGTMQSSSDDQENNDSRADFSISTFFNPQPHHHNSTSALPFDPINSLLSFDPIYTTTQQPLFFPPVPTSQQYNTNTVTHTDTTTTTTTTKQMIYPDDDHHHTLKPRGANTKKKRSRASRRAPTTVMTTDTGNFRAMVQEFTGIPPPPFSSSSLPLVRSSPFDLFAPSSVRSSSFLLRPFAQKFQPPLLSTATYHIQNPVPSLGLDAFGPCRGLQNRPENLLTGGLAGAGVGHDDSADERQSRLLVNGNYDYSHESAGVNYNGNLVNFAAASSDFCGEKVSEKICGRGEGNVEPWICSLDQ